MELSAPVALAVLGAALLHAAWNTLVKGAADKELDTYAVAAGSGLIALVLLPFVPLPAPAAWPWLAASAVVHILYFLFLAGAYRHGDLSYAYPLMRGGGPLIAAAASAVVFSEVLGTVQWAGVLFICAGILALASGVHDRRATLFAGANAFVIGAYTVLDAQGARLSGAPVSYVLWFFVAMAAAIIATGVAKRGAAAPVYLRRHWLRALAGGACGLGSYGIALWAMTRAPVALVAALRETGILFAAVLGALVLHEKLTRRRLIATGAVLAGLVALRI